MIVFFILKKSAITRHISHRDTSNNTKQVESRLWLLLGPYGTVGGMEFDQNEASCRLHICRGLSGVHLLPSLMRNLGIVLTARFIRKVQESGVAGR